MDTNNSNGGAVVQVVDVAALERWAKGYLRTMAQAVGTGRGQHKLTQAAERTMQECLAFARSNARSVGSGGAS